MATKIENTDPYPAPPDKIMEMSRTRDYWEAKYPALGALDFTIHTCEQQGDQWVVSTTREIPADLPKVAKKVIGERTIITQTEKWKSDGAGGYQVDWNCEIKNAPGTFNGWMKITPARDNEADWALEYTVNAGVPVVGKKLEAVVADQTRENLVKEFEFNKKWLAEH